MSTKVKTEQLNEHHHLLDLYYHNVAAIQQDKGKPLNCPRVEYAKKLVTEQVELLEDTLNRPKWSKVITKSDKDIIAEKNWQQLNFMNPYRIIPCQEATLRALEAYRIPLEDMSAFTVIERSHETSSTIFEKEAALLRHSDSNTKVDVNFDAVKKKFQHELSGYNYIAVLEFAIFRKETYRDKKDSSNNGWLISPHLQGIVWKDGGLTRDEVAHFNKKEVFSGGRWNSKGFKHDRVWDVTGSVSYMHKLPLFAYLKSYKHTSQVLPQKCAYIMFQRLKYLDFETMFISGGEGDTVRTAIINYLKNHYQEYPK